MVEATVVLHSSSGAEVHLVGVSHVSAFSGHLAYRTIKHVQPDCVVLEVDERRMHEAAVRAQHWLFDGNRVAVVEHATRVYTHPGAIWSAVLGGVDSRAAITLSNEGAAILEGAVYGSEVILAAQAAAECGADVVLADRSRAISKARLYAATLLERGSHHAIHAEGTPLPLRAVALAYESAARECARVLTALTTSQAHFFAERLHPIFKLVDSPHHVSELRALGCTAGDAELLAPALQRLMGLGSRAGGTVCPLDLKLVRECIARVEASKAQSRAQAFSAVHSDRAAARSKGPCGLHTLGAHEQCCECGGDLQTPCVARSAMSYPEALAAVPIDRWRHTREAHASASGAAACDEGAPASGCAHAHCARGGCDHGHCVRGECDHAHCVRGGVDCARGGGCDHARPSAAAMSQSEQPGGTRPCGTAACQALRDAVEPLSDPFLRWCRRGLGHMHSFALHAHIRSDAPPSQSHAHRTGGLGAHAPACSAEGGAYVGAHMCMVDPVCAQAGAHAHAVGALDPTRMSPYYRTVVHERDAILAVRIRRAAEADGVRRVVCVVGANHLPGIVHNWSRTASQELACECEGYLTAPAAPALCADLAWREHVAQGMANVLMSVAVGAAAYLPARAAMRISPRLALAGGALPLSVLAGLTMGAATSEAWQQQRIAHLVSNMAGLTDD